MTAHKVSVPRFVTQDIMKSYTVNPNSGSAAVDIGCARSGYTFVGVVGAASGNSDVCVIQAKPLNATTIRMYLRNVGNSTVSKNATVTALYMKD